jgi:hypothetical protein
MRDAGASSPRADIFDLGHTVREFDPVPRCSAKAPQRGAWPRLSPKLDSFQVRLVGEIDDRHDRHDHQDW